MSIRSKRVPVVAVLALAAFAVSQPGVSAQDADNDDGEPKKRRVIVIEQDTERTADAEDEDRHIIIRDRELPKYWIGVACSMNDDGVVIGEVLKDSPAEEADLRTGDRILSVGERPVDELSDLVESVQDSKGKEIKLKIQRGDDTVTVAVTPEKRPRRMDKMNWNELQLDEDWSRVLPQLKGLDGTLEDFDISMIHPGLVIGGDEFPSGVSISIHREDDKPAKLTIKRDGDTWEITEDSIDELPKDLRGPARRMLAAVSGRSILRRPEIRKFERVFPGGPDVRFERRRTDRMGSNEELREQLDEMREEIREIRELLQDLRNDK